MEPIKNRYEFTVIFDVENGNPNGDPDAGNMPRIDPETSAGLVTDVCLKRKIRNFVEIFKEDEPYYNILVKPDKALNTKFTEAYEAIGEKTGQKGKNPEAVRAARDYICQNYFDVRTFGAVMSTGNDPCGIVRGPVQICFAKSVDPIIMACSGRTDMCRLCLHRKLLSFRKKILNFCGRPLSICLNTTEVPQEVKCA